MPARYAMTWEPGPRRWRKVFRGRTYTVSCRQLGTAETKEASYQAANAWWTATKFEIDAASPPHPHADYLAELVRRMAWAARRDDSDSLSVLDDEIRRLNRGERPQYLHPSRNLSERYGFVGMDDRYFDEDDPLAPLEPYDPVWADRIARDGATPTPPDRTIGSQVDRYLAVERARSDARQLSVSEFDTTQRCVRFFGEFIGLDLPIDAIDADKFESYYQHLLSLDISQKYKKTRLAKARAFISYLCEKGLITRPGNLASSRLKFSVSAMEIDTMTVEEVRKLVENAADQLKLHLLLMINCGMTQKDISDLHPSEIIESGRIRRRRSKTRDHDKVPVVEYRLWPPTWRLLQQYRRTTGDRVLLTPNGKPWCRDGLSPAGRRNKVDSINKKYRTLQRSLGITKPLKLLRKTSSSMLEQHELYGRYAGLFLGHAPDTVRDRHYVRPSQDRFDDAVRWLGQQYGYVDAG